MGKTDYKDRLESIEFDGAETEITAEIEGFSERLSILADETKCFPIRNRYSLAHKRYSPEHAKNTISLNTLRNWFTRDQAPRCTKLLEIITKDMLKLAGREDIHEKRMVSWLLMGSPAIANPLDDSWESVTVAKMDSVQVSETMLTLVEFSKQKRLNFLLLSKTLRYSIAERVYAMYVQEHGSEFSSDKFKQDESLKETALTLIKLRVSKIENAQIEEELGEDLVSELESAADLAAS